MRNLVDEICKKYDFPLTPLPHQREEVDRLCVESIERSGYYWDMGAGKTFGSTLHTCIYHEQTGAQVIQLCPPILLKQWSRWLTKCGISHKVYVGTPKQRRAITFDRNTRYFLMTVNILKADFERIESDFAVRPIIMPIDEATAIKNYESGNFRAVLQMTNGRAVMPMTGTPLATPRDAYAYIKLVSPGTYRSYRQFENVHVAAYDHYGRPKKWSRLDLLKDCLARGSSFFATRMAHPDMPPCTIDPVEYDLSDHHNALYKKLVDLQLLAYEQTGVVIDATTPNKLYHSVQQIVLNYAHFGQDNSLVPAGFELVDNFLTELRDQKIIIFINYQMTARALMQYLLERETKAVLMNGTVNQKQKDAAMESFMLPVKEGGAQVMVMEPKTGAFGTDGLQDVCNHGLFLETPTIPMYFHQGVKRIDRPGQKFVVDIRVATALGTVQVPLRRNLVENDALVNTIVPSLNDLRSALMGA